MSDSSFLPNNPAFESEPAEKPSGPIPGVEKPPPKYVDDRDLWSADECFQYAKHGTKPINPAFTEFRRQALADVGIDESDDGLPAEVGDYSPAQLFELKKRGQL